MPARFTSATAEGALAKLIGLVLFFVAVIGVGTWYEPFAQGYELKNAANVACNDFVRFTRFGGGPGDTHIEPFLRRATQVGVRLKPNQYSFKAKRDNATSEWVCTVYIKYPTKTDWVIVGPIFEIPPLKQNHVLTYEHRVRENY